MPGLLMRRFLVVLPLLLVWALLAMPAGTACPFCTMQGQTLSSEISQASLVLFGTLQNEKLNAGEIGEGTTDMAIETIVKKHDILGEKKVITLSRYVPPDVSKKYKYLVFCDVFKGKIDPYRGMAVKPDSDIAKYLAGTLTVKDKDVPTRLRFFFDYLDNEDVEVANDAYKEFGNADYKDFRAMAKELSADKVAGWLKDPKTPSFRYGLYASMLGHSGKEEHAKLLRGMLDDPERRVTTGADGILAGYVMLKPKEGWEYLRGVLKDPSKDFTTRYAALRATRFFVESRTDVMTSKDVMDAVCLLLDQGDIADLAIEDLRKWKVWDVADQVLALRGRSSHDISIIRRSILRYALSCPKPATKGYVDELRKKDAQAVTDAEELLRLETAVPVASPPASAAKPATK